jgi:hypothetical protein
MGGNAERAKRHMIAAAIQHRRLRIHDADHADQGGDENQQPRNAKEANASPMPSTNALPVSTVAALVPETLQHGAAYGGWVATRR